MAPTADRTTLPGWSGHVLDRRYRLGRIVGRGGFGTVLEGHHLTLDVPVAVKVLHLTRETAGAERHAEALAAFVDEARIVARLRHPNIVSVLDSGVAGVGSLLPAAEGSEESASSPVSEDATPWFVMEWCEGTPLDVDLDARRGSGGRSVEETWRILGPIVQAVAYGHDHGVAHRDLKPSNVILARDAKGRITPRLLDFGIAKHVDPGEDPGTGATVTQSSRRTFTPAYAAPEQLLGLRTGPWTDVLALALVLVEMLTDRSPYGDESPAIVAMDAERPTPAKLGVDAGAWEPVLRKALAIKAAERFANAGELLAALEAGLPSGVKSGSTSFPSLPSTVLVPAQAAARSVTWSAATLEAPPQPPPPRGKVRMRLLAAGGLVTAVLVTALVLRRTPDPTPARDPGRASSDGATAAAPTAERAPPPVVVTVAPAAPSGDLPSPASADPAAAKESATAAPSTSTSPKGTSRPTGSAPTAKPAASQPPATTSPTSTSRPHLY